MPTRAEDFDEFVAAATPSLVRFATSLTGSAHEGWDLLQDGLIRLYRAWPRVSVGRDPHAYARTILVRLNLNRLRAAGREAAARARSYTPGHSDPPSPSPFEPWLENALAGLSPRQRSAVVLVHVWGYSIEEAADLMNCRPNTLKTHLSRGLQYLRAAANNHREEL